jgi:hypothetical protein
MTSHLGRWEEVPDSSLRAVAWPANAPTDPPVPHPDTLGKGVGYLYRAWNGWAFDRDRGLVWLVALGGHRAYAGTEVYRCDLATFTWTRPVDPLPVKPLSESTQATPLNPDGSPADWPVSSHRYACMTVLPDGRVWFGPAHADAWNGGSSVGVVWPGNVWTFDPADRRCTNHPVRVGSGIVGWAAFDPVGNRIFVGRPNGRALYSVVAAGDTFEVTRQSAVSTGRADGSAAVFAEHRLLGVAMMRDGDASGARRIVVEIYDILDDGTLSNRRVFPLDMTPRMPPGIDVDPRRARFVIWSGGPGLGYADGRAAWVETTQGGPDAQAARNNGIYNRWSYVATLDAFVTHLDPMSNMWLWRPGHAGL